MSLTPDQWEPMARGALRAKFPNGWRLDEMVGAAVLRYAELHARNELPAKPTLLAVIARNAGIDELRRLEGRELLRWAVPASSAGAYHQTVDDQAHDFADDTLDQILAATRAGEIMGSDLTPQERRVIRLRARGLSLADIGDKVGVSEARVCQVLKRLVKKI